jgi:thioester reductase-like protein
MAEMEVKRMKYDYPVTIYRPSVVCGDSRTGETAKYDGVYYVINYLRKFPRLLSLVNIGNEKVRLNIVPVDFVVDAIAALSTDERAAHKTLHIADPNPITSAEMCEVIGRALGGNRSLYKLPMNLCEKILMLPITPAISGLPHSGVPYFFVEQSYDTEIAAELLAPHGIACPRFTDYVGNLTKFVALNPKL